MGMPRFRVRTLLFGVAIVAGFVASFEAGRRYGSSPHMRTITVVRRLGDGTIATEGHYSFNLSDPRGAAAFRRAVAGLKADKTEYRVR
jgi:hypothetical protein